MSQCGWSFRSRDGAPIALLARDAQTRDRWVAAARHVADAARAPAAPAAFPATAAPSSADRAGERLARVRAERAALAGNLKAAGAAGKALARGGGAYSENMRFTLD